MDSILLFSVHLCLQFPLCRLGTRFLHAPVQPSAKRASSERLGQAPPYFLVLLMLRPDRLARKLLRGALLKGLRPHRMAHEPPLMGRPLQGATLKRLSVHGLRGQHLAAWLAVPDASPDQRMQDDGSAAAVTVRGTDTHPMPHRFPVVVALHGWGANAATLWDVVQPIVAGGMAVALFDTTCHGESADEDFSSLPRFAEDLAAVVQALRFEPWVDPTRVALLGHSVGAAAVVLHAARQGGVRAVVALALFADPQDMMLRWLDEHRIPRRWIGRAIVEEVQAIIGERYAHIAPERMLPQVKCPVLLVHARHDTVVPLEDAQRLQAVLREGECLLVDGDHDLRGALEPHAQQLMEFLAAALLRPPPPPP